MKTLHVLALAFALTSATASIASAHPVSPRVDRRQASQHFRMREGVRSGDLTRGEWSRLRAGQRELRRFERRALADGVLTRRERRQLERMQDLQSRRIARMRHNMRGHA